MRQTKHDASCTNFKDEFEDSDDDEVIEAVIKNEEQVQYDDSIRDMVVGLWNSRKSKLETDFAILGWMLSVVPEIKAKAKNYNSQQEEAAICTLKKLWYSESEIKEKFDEKLNEFFEQLCMFHDNTGLYAKENHCHEELVKRGESHIWHREVTLRNGYEALAYTAMRVCSKILGIGAAERSWGDVKTIQGPKRKSLHSKRLSKQAVCYTSHCIQSKRKKLREEYKDWNSAIEEFIEKIFLPLIHDFELFLPFAPKLLKDFEDADIKADFFPDTRSN